MSSKIDTKHRKKEEAVTVNVSINISLKIKQLKN